jgi:N-acetylglutamate synthase-like GNAT family acetyltransferase
MDLLIRRAKSSDFPALAQLISTTDAWQRYEIDYEAALNIFVIIFRKTAGTLK